MTSFDSTVLQREGQETSLLGPVPQLLENSNRSSETSLLGPVPSEIPLWLQNTNLYSYSLADKRMDAIFVELAFLMTTSPSEKKTIAVTDTLVKAFNLLAALNRLPWTPNIEQAVKNLKLCIYYNDLRAQEQMSSSARFRNNDVQVAIKVLERMCKLIQGPDSFNFYSTLFMSDDPAGFHFLDLIDPRIFQKTGKHADCSALLKLIQSSVLQARITLAIAESKVLAQTSYVSISQSTAGSIEEILNSLMRLYVTPVQEVKVDLVHDVFLTILEVAPMKRLSERFSEQVNDFVMQCLEARPVVIQLEYLLSLIIELVKNESPATSSLSKNLLMTKGREKMPITSLLVEKSLNFLNTWLLSFMNKSDQLANRSRQACIHLRLMTHFAKNNFEEFMVMSNRCMEVVLNILDTLNDFEDLFLGDDDQQQGFKEKDDHPKTASQKLFIYRQSLHFVEAVFYSVNLKLADNCDQKFDRYTDDFLNTWKQFLVLVPALMTSRVIMIPQGVLDCFASLGSHIFNIISMEQKIHCMVSFLGYARDERRDVRVKAGRCLAIFLEFEELTQYYGSFLMDALEVIETNIKDGDEKTLVSFAWAFGNLSHILLTYYDNQVPSDSVDERFLERLLQVAEICTTNSKTRYNGYRSIGNILMWSPTQFYKNPGRPFLPMLTKFTRILMKQVGIGADHKARWNACHALGCVLQNERLVKAYGHHIIEPILNTLSHCAVRTESFKEKIQCINGLYKLQNREYYARSYFMVWERVFKALEGSIEMDGNKEHAKIEKHITEVIYRGAFCLAYLTTLLKHGDLVLLDDLIFRFGDCFASAIEKFSQDIRLPDQQMIMENARLQIAYLKQHPAINRLRCISLLSNIFVGEFE